MINFNGDICFNNEAILPHDNRGLKYGDALFETMRCVHGTIFFWEDHYFRLMASMRILRMEIPMNFTLEFLEDEIIKTVKENDLIDGPARVRVTVFRNEGGLYNPKTNETSYLIEVDALESPFYLNQDVDYEVELFKDYFVNKDMLSNLKTTNKILNVVASVYAKENGYNNCLLVNNDKNVVEAINGNLFLVKDGKVKTPPLDDGCLNGIIRKKLIEILSALENTTIKETSISPFELQKADELFITNSIVGIVPVTKYRKKTYDSSFSKSLIGKLNAKARVG
ncbi:aminotransferase class IV [Flagellimonas sp. S3867]|uniref:aminotransferase class IV n=1 Tax=Flagellimonas sp. S3867 TaxID=2768063 RepID=UPI0016856043|nr:aminotransferase class IV [Flagellimonas sp. S3867]